MRKLIYVATALAAVACGKNSTSPTTTESSKLAAFSASLSPQQIDAEGKFLSCGEFMVRVDNPDMYVASLPEPGRIFRDGGYEEIGYGRIEMPPSADGSCEYKMPEIKLQEGKWYWWNLQKMRYQKADGTILSLSTTNCRTRAQKNDEKVQHLLIGGQDRYEGIVAAQVVNQKMLVSVCALDENTPVVTGDQTDVEVKIDVIQ